MTHGGWLAAVLDRVMGGGTPARVVDVAAGGPRFVTAYRHVRADGVAVFTEDVAVRAVVPGAGSIAGQSYECEVFDPSGVAAAGPTAAIGDAVARTVLMTLSGLTLALGRHRFALFRSDAGTRTEVVWGSLWVANVRAGG